MPVDFSPEDQLCLLLARARFSPGVAKQSVERLVAAASWDALLERARTHGLVPLVYHRLQALEFPGVPAQVRRKLTDAFGVNAIRNEMMAKELVHVLSGLGAAGIRVIPLKGVALAESLYGDTALRTCADLDILIHPEDLEESLHVLGLRGYKHALAPPPSIRLLARYGRDCALVRDDERWAYPLQVHCGLIWGGPAERALLAGIWSRAAAQPFHGEPVYGLNPTDEFLYLAVHAARHGLSSFKWIVDLDWLVYRGHQDWNEVRDKTRELGWEDAVGFPVAACASLLQTLIPEPLAEMCAVAQARVRKSETGPMEILRQTIFVIRLQPTLPQRAGFIAARLFIPTPADGDVVRLPPPLFFLYFVLRPCRLMFTALNWLIQAGVAKVRGKSQLPTDR